MFKLILGCLMVIAGIALGLYVGVWVCFVGGWVDIVTQIKAEDMVVLKLGFGILKVITAGLSGFFCACFLIIPGAAFVSAAK